MNRFFMLFAVVALSMGSAMAQTKTPAKADTSKVKANQKPQPASLIKIDSLNVKYPLSIPKGGFDKIDDADINLRASDPIEKYGFIDTADLKMTSCDFEKDANAMVLFDRAEMTLNLTRS